MKTLNLQRIHEICEILSQRQSELEDDDKYVYLLGTRSNYTSMTFKDFLNYYSFRIDDGEIVVFNDDAVNWEDYTKNDFSSFPLFLTSFGAKDLNEWIDDKIKAELREQEIQKIEKKKNLELQIERLQTELNNL